jgi:hypothetical protein
MRSSSSTTGRLVDWSKLRIGRLGEFGDVRAQRKRLGTGWGDLVGRHVVADLEQDRGIAVFTDAFSGNLSCG